MRYITLTLLIVAVIYIFTGGLSAFGLASFFNYTIAEGTSVPTLGLGAGWMQIVEYYQNLSIKDFFVSIEWTLFDKVMIGLFLFLAIVKSSKIAAVFLKNASYVEALSLPFRAFLIALVAIFAPYKMTISHSVVDDKNEQMMHKEKALKSLKRWMPSLKSRTSFANFYAYWMLIWNLGLDDAHEAHYRDLLSKIKSKRTENEKAESTIKVRFNRKYKKGWDD